jgi:tetratricopeptide (TPR) repeat protein
VNRLSLGSIVAALLALLALTPACALALDEAQIADDVAKLGDPDAAVRQRAADALWAAGRPAEAALRQALSSDDPEVVRRARSVLVRFDLGLYPDTPQEILDHVSAYRGGDGVARWAAVHGLANQGNRGLRVLLGLRRLSHDPEARGVILRAIGSRPHERQGAALMLGEGDVDAALSILQRGSLEDESAIRDYAALLLIHGGLDEAVNAAKAEAKASPDGFASKRLVYLARASGELPTAIDASAHTADAFDHTPNSEMTDSLLIESRNWNQLALLYRQRPGNSSETLGFTAAFCRLAGHADGFNSAVAALRALGNANDEEYWNAAECLMLNDHIDEGVGVLLANKNYLAAMDFLLARLKIADALMLIPKARHDLKPADFLQFRARAISAYTFVGDRAKAEQELHDIFAENQKLKDLPTYLRLADAAREMKKPADVDRFLAAALELPSAGDGSGVLEQAGLGDGFPAVFWWRFLRTQHLTEPYAQTLLRLRELAGGKMPPADVEALAAAAQNASASATILPLERQHWLQSIGQTLQHLGRYESAERTFAALVRQFPTFTSLEHLGNCQAAAGDYSAAAATYDQAWDLDRTRAIPLALRSWALLKLGKKDEARQAIDLAHTLPFGDDVGRTSLEEVFRAHGLADDARRERKMILKTGRLFSWEVCHAHHLDGDDENAAGDYAASVDSWELAFLRNLRKDTAFLVPVVNASVPAMIHKARAMALIKQSPDAALAQARLAMLDTPQDADVLIDLVQAFDQAGHKAQGDALFESSALVYRQLCEDFPASPSAHNLLAWAAGRCGRNLDEALKHALRSVELQPNTAENLDTLAVVYFARGEYPKAVAEAARCVELSPGVEHYQKQLEKFKAGAAVRGK